MSPEPRLISEVINRQTGTLIQVDFGINEMDSYQATCYGKHNAQGELIGRSHGFCVNAETLKSIQSIATDPLGWCEECQRTHAIKTGEYTKEQFAEDYMEYGTTEFEIDIAFQFFTMGIAFGKEVV